MTFKDRVKRMSDEDIEDGLKFAEENNDKYVRKIYQYELTRREIAKWKEQSK